MSYRITSFPMNAAELQASSLLTGAFLDVKSAARAWELANGRGYSADDVSIVISNDVPRPGFRRSGHPRASRAGARTAVERSRKASCAWILARLALGRLVRFSGLQAVAAGPLVDVDTGSEVAIGEALLRVFPDNHTSRIEDHVRRGRILMVLQARSPLDAQAIGLDWKPWALEVLGSE